MDSNATRVVLQVGSELRIKNTGELILGNPEIELGQRGSAADAVIAYRFDQKAGEHVIRLLDPVADHRHMKEHRPGD